MCLVELAKRDLGKRQDDLARARCAARGGDATAQWGMSGESLNDMIARYERLEREARVALAYAQGLTA